MFENKYPYTDFSQLNLDWFLLKFKELLVEQERVSEKVADLDEIVKEFTRFVSEYFDELDVQQEINNKLDVMAADGTLSELLEPLVSGQIGDVVSDQIGDVVAGQIGDTVAGQIGDVVADQIDDAVDPKIGPAVTSWLDDNVDPVGSAVVVDSTLSIAGAAADAKETGDELALKAEKTGLFPGLNVGNLISNTTINDQSPYLFRTTAGGNDVINRKKIKSIDGASVTWNQLVNTGDTSITIDNGHKYISHISGIWGFGISDGTSITVDGANGDNVFDISRMFDSTIADYVDTLETATAGSGIAWLRSYGFLTKDYYPYNAGEIISVKTLANEAVGFNLYDHSSGYARLVGDRQYQITGTYSILYFAPDTGELGTLITADADGYFTVSDNGVLSVTGGNNTDTCVHLVWDDERDGEYESYIKHTNTFDSDLELRGVYKLDVNNNIYADGDKYAPNGTVTRKYETYTFTGSEIFVDWVGAGTSLTIQLSNVKSASSNNEAANILWALGATEAVTDIGNQGEYSIGVDTNGRVYIATTKTSAQLATALTGKTLIFEGATPTTESADSYDEEMIIDDWGTERFIDNRTVPMPVGHNTVYYPDLKAKLEMLPNNPDTDGDYILRRVNGINTWVLLT